MNATLSSGGRTSGFFVLLPLAIVLSAATAQSDPAKPAPHAARPRESAILSVLQHDLDWRRSGWFWRSWLEREQVGDSALDTALLLPQIRPTCGNSMGGSVTQAQIDALVTRLARAFDPAGTKPEIAFDEKKFPIMDGDTYTPLSTVAVDVVERLNATHDGEDVDLSLLASSWMDVWPLPPAKSVAGRVEPSVARGICEFKVETILHFSCRPDATGAGAAQRERFGKEKVEGPVRSTKGRVALLLFPAYANGTSDGMPTLSIQVGQGGELITPSPVAATMIWLPSTFDAGKPFEIEATFSPGAWTWGQQVHVTAPDR
jgi:hypothetical protein